MKDIYAELQRISNAPKNICDYLKQLEYNVEFEQSIPITENIRQVKAGDILISDMYLPESFIRQLLNKAGLLTPVEIVITNNGKSSGRIWKQIADQKEFVFHIGDNQDADIKNPRLAGFESAISILSNPTSVERYLLQKNFNFGAYIREIRLCNPFTEEINRLYWQLFTVNIGILLLLVQQLDTLQKTYGFEYLGFCGRDTYYLRLLYEKYKRELGETPVPNDYLYYSRKLTRNSGEDLAKYFADRIDNRKALMIDLFGTGTHLHNMRIKFGLSFSVLICLLFNSSDFVKNYYSGMETIKDCISFIENPDKFMEKNINLYFVKLPNGDIAASLENLNRATHNSPVRLKAVQIGEKIFPKVTFSESNDTEKFEVMERCFNEVLKSKLVVPKLNSKDIEESLRFLLKVLISSLVQLPLRNQHQLIDQVDMQYFKVF